MTSALLQQLVLRVQRAYSAGATAAALRDLSLSIADLSGVPPPAGGGVAGIGEYVLDWFNFARHALPQRPARLGQPATAAPPPPPQPQQQQQHMPPRAPMARPRATSFSDMDEASGGGGGGRGGMTRTAWGDSDYNSGGSAYDDARGGGGEGGGGGLERSPVGRRPVTSQRPLTAPAAGGGMGVSPLGPVAGLGRGGGGSDDEDELTRMLAQTPRDTSGMLRVLESLTGGDPASDLPLSALSTVCR